MTAGKTLEMEIFWQAHRGGGGVERPDNTLCAIEYGWSLGAIPEVDIRLTADGVLICLHDDTLERTTDAPAEIAKRPAGELSLAAVRSCDAGCKFAPIYAGEKVPTLDEVFARLKADARRRLYADLKQHDEMMLDRLAELEARHGCLRQVIVCSNRPEVNRNYKRRFPQIQTMLWVGGTSAQICSTFAEQVRVEFADHDEVQLHLFARPAAAAGEWFFDLPADFLREALAQAGQAGVRLQVFPWTFTNEAIFALLDLGVRGYATDEPQRFREVLREWESR